MSDLQAAYSAHRVAWRAEVVLLLAYLRQQRQERL